MNRAVNRASTCVTSIRHILDISTCFDMFRHVSTCFDMFRHLNSKCFERFQRCSYSGFQPGLLCALPGCGGTGAFRHPARPRTAYARDTEDLHRYDSIRLDTTLDTTRYDWIRLDAFVFCVVLPRSVVCVACCISNFLRSGKSF